MTATPRSRDYAAVAALVEAAAHAGLHGAPVGLTATAPGFYGAQGRPIPQLPIRYPDLAAELAAQGVVNFEMEASALLVLAAAGGRSGRGRVHRLRPAQRGEVPR